MRAPPYKYSPWLLAQAHGPINYNNYSEIPNTQHISNVCLAMNAHTLWLSEIVRNNLLIAWAV